MNICIQVSSGNIRDLSKNTDQSPFMDSSGLTIATRKYKESIQAMNEGTSVRMVAMP